jgi:hypothetical protein
MTGTSCPTAPARCQPLKPSLLDYRQLPHTHCIPDAFSASSVHLPVDVRVMFRSNVFHFFSLYNLAPSPPPTSLPPPCIVPRPHNVCTASVSHRTGAVGHMQTSDHSCVSCCFTPSLYNCPSTLLRHPIPSHTTTTSHHPQVHFIRPPLPRRLSTPIYRSRRRRLSG